MEKHEIESLLTAEQIIKNELTQEEDYIKTIIEQIIKRIVDKEYLTIKKRRKYATNKKGS